MATYTSNIKASFDSSGNVVITGAGSAVVGFKLTWNDNPTSGGDAVGTIQIVVGGSSISLLSSGVSGTSVGQATFTAGTYSVIYNSLLNPKQIVNNSQAVRMDDNTANTSTEALLEIDYITQQPFDVTINNFSASPNPQLSSSGTPASNTILTWSSNGSNAEISENIGTVAPSDTLAINTGLQSWTGTNSPATRSYTLRVWRFDRQFFETSSLTVSVKNDNTPDPFSISSLFGVNPGSEQIVTVGPITGVDMPTIAVAGPGVSLTKDQVFYSSTVTITSGESFYAKVLSPGFNTSPLGLVNSQDFYVDVGTVRRYFTIQTRAPRIDEIFDFPSSTTNYPYPDIDLVTNTPDPYMTSPLTIIPDDLDLANPNGTEITTTEPETQIRVKPVGTAIYGSWTYLRQSNFNNITFSSLQARSGLVSNPTPRQFNTRNFGTQTSSNILS